MNRQRTTDLRRDHGGGLVVVAVLIVVLALVALSAAELSATTLRTSGHADRQMRALTAAEAGARQAMVQLGDGEACTLPAGFTMNGAALAVSCRPVTAAPCEVDIRSIATVAAVRRVIDARFRSDGELALWHVADPSSTPFQGPATPLGPGCPTPPPPTSCAFIGGAASVTSTGTQTVLDIPAGAQPGDEIVTSVTVSGTTADLIDPGPAWTVMATISDAGGVLTMRLYRRTLPAATIPTPTFSAVGEPPSVGMVVLRDCFTASPPTPVQIGGRSDQAGDMLSVDAPVSDTWPSLVTFFASNAPTAPHTAPTGATAAFRTDHPGHRTSAWWESQHDGAAPGERNAGPSLDEAWVSLALSIRP